MHALYLESIWNNYTIYRMQCIYTSRGDALSDLSDCLFSLASCLPKINIFNVNYPNITLIYITYLYPDLSRRHGQQGRSSGCSMDSNWVGLRFRYQWLAMFIWNYDVWWCMVSRLSSVCVCACVFFQCLGLNLAGRERRKQLHAVQLIWYHLSGRQRQKRASTLQSQFVSDWTKGRFLT